MSYRIPTDWDIIRAIEHVLKRRGFVNSNEELCYLALRRLKRSDKDFVVSPERVRRVAMGIPEVEIKVKTKSMGNRKKLKECPVCGNNVKRTFRKNLSGRRVHTGYKCSKCDFRCGLDSTVPMKYRFVWKDRL
jgi:predicted RNA-binding Zn-ribbon protein involved in translation (DUF1610 family)